MNLPALRFKDDNGQDFPDWKHVKVGELGEFIGGGTPSTQNRDFWTGDIPWVSSSDLTEENIHQINTTRFITKDAIKKSATKLVPKNSILIVSRVGVGKVAIASQALCTSQDFTSLDLHSGSYVFFAYLIKIKTNKLLEFNQGTSIKGFVKSDLESLIVGVPRIDEQTKVANFLTAVDEKITQLTKKHDLLTQYKKGVMQQIFSQELRFKDDDGEDFPEWEEKELRTLCDLITKGTTPTSVGHEFKTSGINFIKIESLEADGKLIKEKLGFIDADAHAKLFRSQLKLYDLLFSIAGALGRVAIVTDEFLPANTNQALAIIRLSEGQSLDTKYVFYTLTNDRIKKLIESISVQLAQANLSLKDIGDFVIELPCIKEQTKIANFLTAIDDKITATQAQLHAVKQYKHGLLQQMFV